MAKRKKSKVAVQEGTDQVATEATAATPADSALSEGVDPVLLDAQEKAMLASETELVAETEHVAEVVSVDPLDAAVAAGEKIETVVASDEEFNKTVEEIMKDPNIQKVMDELAPHDISEQTKQAQRRQKFMEANPDDDIMTLEQAAMSMVDGFKESWLPAIRVKARSMGYDGATTRATWRAVFVAWGGQAILK